MIDLKVVWLKCNINAETFLAHLIHISTEQQRKYYNQLYHNIYANNIMNREWRGHLDAINDITFVEDPISIVTISNDMYMRVWDKKFELIGEINIFPNETNNKFTKQHLVPWGFKVNEKRIIEKEINEVVEIFESVGIKKIIFGSEEDQQNEALKKMKKEEKARNTKKNVENEEDLRKRTQVRRKKYEMKKDEFEYTTGYELVFLKNLTTNIEFLLQNKLYKEGMGEISNNLMSSMINEKNKIFSKKNKEKQISMNSIKKYNKIKALSHLNNINAKNKYFSLVLNQEEDDNKSLNFESETKKIKTKSISEKFKLGATFSPSRLSNIIINLNKNENNKDFSKDEINKIKKDRNSEVNVIKNSKLDLISNNESIKESKEDSFVKIDKIKYTSSFKDRISNNNYASNSKRKINTILKERQNMNSNIFSDSNSLRPFSNTKMPRKNFSSEMLSRKNSARKAMTRPVTGKENRIFGINNFKRKINRNDLYSQKLFNRFNSNSAIRKGNIFPNLKEKLSEAGEKINFLNFNVKEKTESLVKTQFYLNSYKNCCKILPNNSLSTNISIKLNYQNMWNNVKLYTNHIKERHSALEKKTTPIKRKMERSKSVRAFKRKFS